jgi:hypothetical protein
MPVYLITLHAYRSWGPDKSRGFVRKDERIQPPNEELARMYDGQANDDPVTFSTELQRVLIVGAFDICSRRNWHLHAIGTDPTHGHFLVSEKEFMDWEAVRDKLKNILSLLLGRATGQSGKPWFVAKGSRKRVEDQKHFDYLVNTYLPDQRRLFWKKGSALPDIPVGIL